MICRRSFSELQWLELVTDLTPLGSVEIHQILFLRWILVSDFHMGAVSCLLLEQLLDRFVLEAASVLTEILSYRNLFVVSPMVRSINYFWVLPTLSIPVKGKRFTSECWIVSRFSVRWSSSSTILTLMAWRFNIPQKSFLCKRLFIPSEEWFVFYMQMTVSTTGRRLLCILCSVYVLSKMLKLCGAEGSSFRWLLGAVSRCCGDPSDFVFEVDLVAELAPCFCWGSLDWPICEAVVRFIGAVNCLLLRQHLVFVTTVRGQPVWFCSLDAVSLLLLKQRPGVSSDSLIFGFRPSFRERMPVVEIHQILFLSWIFCTPSVGCSASMLSCSEMRHVRWWACSGSNHQSASDEGQWLVVQMFVFESPPLAPDITACLSQLFGSWVHWWRRVPCCDNVVKTENLDWIFLLDVSLLWGWPVDASVLLSTSGNLDLFQIY